MPETLRQLISRGPVDLSTALDILGQLLNALEFAHWRGIIYGDISPERIVLTSTGQATLAEFAIAHVGDEPTPTRAGTGWGTSAYLAPEQIKGDPADERTDIFAMGVVAYEMLTGKHPFGASDGLSADAVTEHILHDPALGIPQLTLASLSAHIPQVLEVALAKNPKDRFPDAISFLDALKGTTAVADVVVPGESPRRYAVSPRRSRSRRAWVTYALLGVLLAVALWVLVVVALSGNSGAGSSTTVTSAGVTSTGQSAPAIVPPATTTSVAPTTTISTTTSTTTATTISTPTSTVSTTTTTTPIRFEQTDARLLYTGAWTTTASGSASGGSLRFANSKGASVTISFQGTYLAWIAKKSPAYGKAKVTVDKQAPVTVDLYSAATLWQQKVWNTGALPFGSHTLKIEWTGTKNTAATGNNINVDAFDVAGSLTQAP